MKRTYIAAAILAVVAMMIPGEELTAQTIPVDVKVTPASSDGTVPVTLQWSATGATSCTASGGWSGTKAASGSQQITPPLSASATFTLNCTAPGTAQGVTLEWEPPTQNTNGTPLTNLAGYRVRYGSSPSALSQSVAVSQASATGTVISSLTAGTWHFSVHAVTAGGAESVGSNPVSATTTSVPRTGTGSATHTVNPVPRPPSDVTVRTTDQVAYQIRQNSDGKLVASRIGVVPLGAICSGETQDVGGVTYNRVDERSVDLVNWPASFRPIETWARCG